ncbi:LamG domain-containing protein [Marilutibacter spongiae]|uniref:LamG domain-containing protein n=1 Tax=Marilutibacter spongiae TaxID=2025720 RepID=A0A7W3Y5P9_9GAMM|nr:LamG domain-containing protein [Lysobacter spongiae]MBB1060437.1 LamG domain-containing protein [Lysobacter spongiae]
MGLRRLMMAQPTGGDPYFGSVTSLLHMEGANGGTTFTDIKSNTWTRTASAVTSTAQAVAGSSSMFVASGNIQSTTAIGGGGVGTGNFTIEGWFRATATTARGLFHTALSGSAAGIAAGWDQTSGMWQVYFNGSVFSSSATSLTLNTWIHFALVRNGTSCVLYINGTAVVSFTSSANITAAGMTVGAYFNASFPWVGYIDEFRITKGVARYTGAFTPPSVPFPNS